MSVAVDPELLAKLPIVPVPALPPSRRPKHVIQEAEMTRGVPKIPLQLPARVFINKTKDGKRVKIFGILHYVDNEMGEKDFIFRGRRLNTMYCFQFGTEFFVRPTTVQQKGWHAIFAADQHENLKRKNGEDVYFNLNDYRMSVGFRNAPMTIAQRDHLCFMAQGEYERKNFVNILTELYKRKLSKSEMLNPKIVWLSQFPVDPNDPAPGSLRHFPQYVDISTLPMPYIASTEILAASRGRGRKPGIKRKAMEKTQRKHKQEGQEQEEQEQQEEETAGETSEEKDEKSENTDDEQQLFKKCRLLPPEQADLFELIVSNPQFTQASSFEEALRCALISIQMQGVMKRDAVMSIVG